MTSSFDRALEGHALWSAANEFALRHGQPGTPAYRTAWIRFRRDVRTTDDLRRELRTVEVRRDVIARDVLNATIGHAIRADETTMATAQLLDPTSRALRLVAHRGFAREFLDYFEIVDDTTTSCGTALDRSAPVLVPDMTRSPIFAGTAGLHVILRAGSRACASIPVTTPTGRVIAMISTHHQQTMRWTDDRLLALRDLSGSAGHLLHHLLNEPTSGRPRPA